MRRVTIGVIICMSLCAAIESSANEFRNPGFDDGIYWSQDLSPWTTTSPNQIHWFWESAARKSGRWSLIFPSDETLAQRVAVSSFTDYMITVPLASHDEGLYWGQNVVRFYVDGEEVSSLLTHLTGNYRYLSTTFNTGNRDSITVGIRPWACGGAGMPRLDDIVLAQVDSVRPYILSAIAYDGEVQLAGIDDDDCIVITFSEPTNTPRIRSSNIDEVFHILSGHTWLSSEGRLWSTTWNAAGDILRIDLYAVTGEPPTVEVGDQFHADLYTIKGECGNPVYRGLVPITIEGTLFGGPLGPRVGRKEPLHSIDVLDMYNDNVVTTKDYIYEPQ